MSFVSISRLILAGALAFSVAACGDDDVEGDAGPGRADANVQRDAGEDNDAGDDNDAGGNDAGGSDSGSLVPDANL